MFWFFGRTRCLMCTPFAFIFCCTRAGRWKLANRSSPNMAESTEPCRKHTKQFTRITPKSLKSLLFWYQIFNPINTHTMGDCVLTIATLKSIHFHEKSIEKEQKVQRRKKIPKTFASSCGPQRADVESFSQVFGFLSASLVCSFCYF